jgi:hypothetical protein
MDEVPVGTLAAGALVVLVGPLRRRAISAARATGRAGVGILAATVAGAADIVNAAVRGASPERPQTSN